MHSLQGQFSGKVQQLVESLTRLRIYVEAAIDFPDEEIDFLSDGKVAGDLYAIMSELDDVRGEAKQGALLREGMKVVIAGRPNAGKSSLLNALAGRESAIVTEIAGTTRDVLREHIHLDGMPLHIIDTAGLRDTQDKVEQIGIERAWAEIEQADRVLFMVDGTTTDAVDPTTSGRNSLIGCQNIGLTVVRNKADLTGEDLAPSQEQGHAVYRISAKTELGLPALREHLKACMGFQGNTEGGFMARRRHLDAWSAPPSGCWWPGSSLRSMWLANWWPRSCAWPRSPCPKSRASSAPTICWAASSPASASGSNVVKNQQ